MLTRICQAAGGGYRPIRATLEWLQAAAVPLALVTTGMGLAAYRFSSGLRDAIVMSATKLIVQPALG